MTPKQMEASRKRTEALLKDGAPKWIHVYDNGGKTADRYMAVFTGRYTHKTLKQHWSVSMSADPFAPQGCGISSEDPRPIDYPTYGHLGKKIKFVDLPKDCQRLVFNDYRYLWDLPLQFEAENICVKCGRSLRAEEALCAFGKPHTEQRIYVKAAFHEKMAEEIKANKGRLPEAYCP